MRCIIIDDDSVSRRILAEYIARTDFLVDAGQFATSIEAINFLHTNPDIDLIFLDVRLPEMDGFEFQSTTCLNLWPTHDSTRPCSAPLSP